MNLTTNLFTNLLEDYGFHKVYCVDTIYELEVENEFIKYFNVHIIDDKFIVSIDSYGHECKVKEVTNEDQLKSLFKEMCNKDLHFN